MRALCSGPNSQALSHLHKWKRNKTSYERKFISSKLEKGWSKMGAAFQQVCDFLDLPHDSMITFVEERT